MKALNCFKHTTRLALAAIAFVAVATPGAFGQTWLTNNGEFSTTSNVALNTGAGNTVIPFIIQRGGDTLNATAFYCMRVGDPTSNFGFLMGYDATNNLGVVSAVANNNIGFLTASGGPFVERMRITAAGRVGIGTTAPTQALDVNGSVNVSGNLAAKYQDVAEWVPSAEPLEPGTVVVLNPNKTNEVMASTKSYDSSVAGVVSSKPGLILGEAAENKEQVATTGRVRVRVDATKNPIHIGDLLVTSDKPGVAMRSIPVDLGGVMIHRPGTIVGKALEPLASGEGEILVLLALQ